ncbi:MAG: VWA domain-containing protein, partial [Bacteroidota bacterium]
TEICATLGFSALTNNDKVGLILFTDRVEKYIPPKKGRNHILRIIRELIYFEPTGTTTNLAEALSYLNGVVKKRCIAFVMSDFMTDQYHQQLKISARRHDVIGVRVYDDLESRLPDVGLIKVIDAETNQEILLDTGSSRIRENYEHDFQVKSDYFFDSFRRNGASILTVNTKEDYVKHLMRFFKSRNRK